MRPDYITREILSKFIADSLEEDIGSADHSTLATVPASAIGKAELIIKETGILAGVELGLEILKAVDDQLQINVGVQDGAEVQPGDIPLTMEGRSRSILTAERLFLNCLQRMSGIATYTRFLANTISGTKAKILDTRKTTPNFRIMEKWAVVIGGGENHRLRLSDLIMLKDNHIDFGGGISQTIRKVKDYLRANRLDLAVEIEARDMDEVAEILKTGEIDIIMLDNMLPTDLRRAVSLINRRFKTEASGGITEMNIQDVANTGVDYISVGALTHSAKSIDMSLKAV